MTSKGIILAVDDTHATLTLLAAILTADGYDVHPADSGELALASAVASPPELILLDVLMPGLSGFDVLRQLKGREASRDIPVVFLSALHETAERVEGLKLGAVDFISKPFEPTELLARVATHLALRRLRVRLEQQADELRAAMAKVKLLSGFIPICASCKKIRNLHPGPFGSRVQPWNLSGLCGTTVSGVRRVITRPSRNPRDTAGLLRRCKGIKVTA
jgi:CheY-like chemotaxis protein